MTILCFNFYLKMQLLLTSLPCYYLDSTFLSQVSQCVIKTIFIVFGYGHYLHYLNVSILILSHFCWIFIYIIQSILFSTVESGAPSKIPVVGLQVGYHTYIYWNSEKYISALLKVTAASKLIWMYETSYINVNDANERRTSNPNLCI